MEWYRRDQERTINVGIRGPTAKGVVILNERVFRAREGPNVGVSHRCSITGILTDITP